MSTMRLVFFEQTTLQVNRRRSNFARIFVSLSLSLVVAFSLFVQAESSRSHLLSVLSTCLILCIRSLINVLERFCCVRADIETRRKK